MEEQFSSVFMYAGDYLEPTDAQADFASLKTLHDGGRIGKYQAALFRRDVEGKVHVEDTTSTTRATGAKWGAAIGAVFGVIFPPSILVGAGVGALTGAGVGTLAKGWLGTDVKRIGGMLEPGHAGVILVAQAMPEMSGEAMLPKAVRVDRQDVQTEIESVNEALDRELTEV